MRRLRNLQGYMREQVVERAKHSYLVKWREAQLRARKSRMLAERYMDYILKKRLFRLLKRHCRTEVVRRHEVARIYENRRKVYLLKSWVGFKSVTEYAQQKRQAIQEAF
jgi:hypothetical protein